MDKEIWKPIDGFDNYMVSDQGRVCRVLAPRLNVHGYPRASLCKDKAVYDRLVHRLVLEAFVGPCPDGMQACHHPSNDRTNAKLDNLRWDTASANNMDKVASGTDNRGIKNHMAKLNETDIERIFDLRKQGCKLKQIGDWFDISLSHIGDVLSGGCWGHLGGAN